MINYYCHFMAQYIFDQKEFAYWALCSIFSIPTMQTLSDEAESVSWQYVSQLQSTDLAPPFLVFD
jgi:hypothetical protein